MDSLDYIITTCSELNCRTLDLIQCSACKAIFCIKHKEAIKNHCNHEAFISLTKSLNDSTQKSEIVQFIDTLINVNKEIYLKKSIHYSEIIQEISLKMSLELARLTHITSNLLDVRSEIINNSKSPVSLIDNYKKFNTYKLKIQESDKNFPDISNYIKNCMKIIPENNYYIELTKITQANPNNYVEPCLDYLKSSDFHLYLHLKEPDFISFNENFLVSLSPSEKNLKVWQLEPFSIQSEIEIKGEVLAADLDIHSNSILLGISPSTIQVLSLTPPYNFTTIEHPDFKDIRCIKSSQKLKLIGNNLCEILVLDHNYTYQKVLSPKNEKSPVLAIAINEASNIFAVSPNNSNILIFSIISLTQTLTIRTRNPSKSLTFHMNRVVISDEKAKIKLINPETGQLENQIPGFEAFSSNIHLNKLFLWSPNIKGLQVYSLNHGIEKQILNEINISTISCDINENFLAFIDKNKELFIFSKELKKCPGHSSAIQRLWFSQSNLITCAGCEVSIWDLQSKKILTSQRLFEEVQSIQEEGEKIIIEGVEGTIYEIYKSSLKTDHIIIKPLL